MFYNTFASTTLFKTFGSINNGNRSNSNRANDVSAVETSNSCPNVMYVAKVHTATNKGITVYNAHDKL